ncbi:type IV toxin-antitoxin system AbiEi family antitoxin [Pseudozobellia thermophila]|uniref:Transcriptional regulator, AbiEi antitoxin, Type IV TA system n=1 Tax=Pseudozobellia thermophila TaxID=192903 RepID=A0A1M6ACF6_9FLAO|nr:type IV toxin-antitoxin system AbiEi family antitoxin [Pseudozobellia thermophila]SHI34190.1 hypothetical protein SAMN04488513_1019 [Pseudozobellia thermophila]
MLSTIYLNEWFDALDFETEVRYLSHNKERAEKIYEINGEPVFVEFKNEVRPQNVYHFIKKRSKKLPVLVASKYITPTAKEVLKAQGINYIESYGNAFLNLEGLKLYIEKNNGKPIYNTNTKIFTQAGCQLIFQLLKHPETINKTVRYLAHQSEVSIGSTSKILNQLQEEGFIIKWNDEKKYQLVNREELLERWIPVFNEKVLPNYKIGQFTFSAFNENDWRNKLLYPSLKWGGEPAASLLTNHLTPELFSLYTTEEKRDIITKFRLVPDPDGPISVYLKFWRDKSAIESITNLALGKNVAHPILIYAELVHSGNERNLETAKIIFDQYVKPNL